MIKLFVLPVMRSGRVVLVILDGRLGAITYNENKLHTKSRTVEEKLQDSQICVSA